MPWQRYARALVPRLAAVALGALLISQGAFPPPPNSATQTQYFLQDKGNPNRRFEVNLDQRQGKVTVQSLGSMTNLPDTMRMTLFNDQSSGRSLTLQATTPPPGSTKLHQQTTYGGEFDPANGPYVAFELQFPLGSSDTRSLKADIASDEQKTP